MTYPVFYVDQSRPIDLICMGRVAVDLYAEQIGVDLSDVSSFKKYLGGCAGNIAVGTSRLGLKSQLFSCVGTDDMGVFLQKELCKERVNTDLLSTSDKHLTGLVLLGIAPPDRFPLIFYRKDCSDMQLQNEHISDERLLHSKSLLITGTGISTQSMKNTTIQVVQRARRAECAVIFDLDFRPVLWGLTSVGNGENRYCQSEVVSKSYQEIIPLCDLIVGTEEELCIAGGANCLEQALATIQQLTNSPIVVKLGEKGAIIHFGSKHSVLKSQPFPVEVLNVLGAGDAFMSGLLLGVLQGESWEKSCQYANACGAIVVTRHGCAPAMPYKEELEYFIAEYSKDPLIWSKTTFLQLHDSYNPSRSKHALIKNPLGFSDGMNKIVSMHESFTGMNFSSLKLNKGEMYQFTQHYEFAALLLSGKVLFDYSGHKKEAKRVDYFSQNPYVLHGSRAQQCSVMALTDCELLLIETDNERIFEPVLFDESNMLELDERGKGILEDTSYRLVRTVFDKRNRPESNLVVGEIITFQGRWSSYPSHYHDQPEIYHYRFSEPQGYAFGESGKNVLRIEHYDTYQIEKDQTHAHCTAPGYALYTLWFIKHLENNPYGIPTFVKDHEWTRNTQANSRVFKRRKNP
ncbi:5-dehydro-2-deoxygluconokinase [Legionella waltersii]|uniref:IolC/IolB transferase kinase protein n=1 Tax=Legionella waltersii TaxID=66969 RepID=A0A0W1A1D0_9GAMM|nr:5-dehydro-2-deoxygluconokinase [Legionella waltersii]KTD75140.1 IolC/IolB transferase kinase protein [Legionella waltersii]SNV04858.1 IolC/IolB transferase kinase protein [Legionella waltersii]